MSGATTPAGPFRYSGLRRNHSGDEAKKARRLAIDAIREATREQVTFGDDSIYGDNSILLVFRNAFGEARRDSFSKAFISQACIVSAGMEPKPAPTIEEVLGIVAAAMKRHEVPEEFRPVIAYVSTRHYPAVPLIPDIAQPSPPLNTAQYRSRPTNGSSATIH